MKPSDVLDILNERGASIPAPPSPNGANGAGRNARGQFAKGNKGGPGNPHARRVADLRKALLDVAGPKAIKRIARKLVAMAESGDLDAAKLLLLYTLGRPAVATNPDDIALQEWRQLTGVGRPQALGILRHTLNPGQALEALAEALGYESTEPLRKVLFMTGDKASDARVQGALDEAEAAAVPGRSRVEIDELVIKQTLPRLINALGSLTGDKTTPAEALAEGEAVYDCLQQLERAGGLDPEDRHTRHLAGRLRAYIEKIRSAATTPDHRDLLRVLTRVAEGLETPTGGQGQ